MSRSAGGETMNWEVFSATFLTIFIAEFGDKTQFAAMMTASQTKSTLSVLLGTILGLSLAGTLGVLFGSVFGHIISPDKMKYISGIVFIMMGIWILVR
jgi:putative Ca2+/H+ antiporter (TMEM165/GDT1 family)